MRLWSIRSSQVAFRRLPDVCSALCYHPRGQALAVGMKNGTMSLLDAQTTQLRTFSSWIHCAHVRRSTNALFSCFVVGGSADKALLTLTLLTRSQAIEDIQFSPNGSLLAVASSGGDVFIYTLASNFQSVYRQAICRAAPALRPRLDFSADSQYVRCDSSIKELKAWHVTGRVVTDSASIANMHWSSWRCNSGWHLVGLNAQHTTAGA